MVKYCRYRLALCTLVNRSERIHELEQDGAVNDEVDLYTHGLSLNRGCAIVIHKKLIN